MTAAMPNSAPALQNNNTHLRVAEAWQTNTSGRTAITEKNKLTDMPKISETEQLEIDKLIEIMHATSEKKELFVLLNKKLRSLSSAKRENFITVLLGTLDKSERPEDQVLREEKVNPAFSMYFVADMYINEFNQEILSKIGQVPREDDDEDDSDEI